MRRIRVLLPALAVAATVVSGCAAGTPGAVPAPTPTGAPSVSPDPTPPPDASAGPTPSESAEPDYRPPNCDASDDLVVAPVGRDAATGTQFLILTFLNCSGETVSLAEPEFRGVDADGEEVALSHDLFDTPSHPTPTLQPGEAAGLELRWANNGRCERGVQRFGMEIAGRELDLTQPCLMLGGEYAAERDTTLTLTWNPDYWTAPS